MSVNQSGSEWILADAINAFAKWWNYWSYCVSERNRARVTAQRVYCPGTRSHVAVALYWYDFFYLLYFLIAYGVYEEKTDWNQKYQILDFYENTCYVCLIFKLEKKNIFLYTCMQNPHLRTVYRQRKWRLPAPVRKIMTAGRKIMALGCEIIALVCKVFY